MLQILLLATVFTANQGSIALVKFPGEPGINSMVLTWNEKHIPFARVADQWETVVGVDVDTKPGDYEGQVDVTLADGKVEKRPVTFHVEGVKFPTTELTVDDQYVELSKANQQRAAREAKELDKIYATLTPEILWAKPFHSPI